MLKVAVARCAFVVLMVSMLAASGADKTVANKELGFEITFPEAWTIDRTTNGPQEPISAYAKQGDSFIRVFVNVIDVTSTSALKDYADENVAKVLHQPIGGCMNEKVEVTERACKVTRYCIKAGEKEVDWFFVSGKHGYHLRMFANETDLDLYAKDIDAIVKSFKLIEAK